VLRADNLTNFMCQLILKSGNFNLLEPSGFLQACGQGSLCFWEAAFTAGKLVEKCSVQKVPRHCPLAVLLKVGWRQGGELGSDGKWTVFGMKQRREAVTLLWPSFDINIQPVAKWRT